MNKYNWQYKLGFFLIVLSAILYFVHYLIFTDVYHIFIYMIGDIAFVPIEVLLVTLIIHSVLSIREHRVKMNKLNMVIGAFFSEVGTDLINFLSMYDDNFELVRKNFIVKDDWSNQDFTNVKKNIENFEYNIDSQRYNLTELRNFLINKREFLLRLLENPNLLEHETFTDLLWATFHLTEELANRIDVKVLTKADSDHISIDIKRTYILLLSEWLDYMVHLNNQYLYLFSLAVRINPFNPDASAEIQV